MTPIDGPLRLHFVAQVTVGQLMRFWTSESSNHCSPPQGSMWAWKQSWWWWISPGRVVELRRSYSSSRCCSEPRASAEIYSLNSSLDIERKIGRSPLWRTKIPDVLKVLNTSPVYLIFCKDWIRNTTRNSQVYGISCHKIGYRFALNLRLRFQVSQRQTHFGTKTFSLEEKCSLKGVPSLLFIFGCRIDSLVDSPARLSVYLSNHTPLNVSILTEGLIILNIPCANLKTHFIFTSFPEVWFPHTRRCITNNNGLLLGFPLCLEMEQA